MAELSAIDMHEMKSATVNLFVRRSTHTVLHGSAISTAGVWLHVCPCALHSQSSSACDGAIQWRTATAFRAEENDFMERFVSCSFRG